MTALTNFQMASNYYLTGNYCYAAIRAHSVINDPKLTPQKIRDWLNPDPAIEYNNKGAWYHAWFAANEMINPANIKVIANFVGAAVIYVDSTIQTNQPLLAREMGESVLASFSGIDYQQRSTRVIQQLDFALFNSGEMHTSILESTHNREASHSLVQVIVEALKILKQLTMKAAAAEIVDEVVFSRH